MAETEKGQEKQGAHTPGPWVRDGYNLATIIHCVTPPGPTARHTCGDYEVVARAEGENWKANARLIAAAPKTTESLRELHAGLTEMIEEGRLQASDIPDDYFWLRNQLERADAILAKALGKID